MATHAAAPTRLTGFRGGAFQAFRWLSALFSLLVVIQIALAGYGAFKLLDDPNDDKAFDAHAGFGFTAIHLCALLIFITVLLARPGRNLVIAGVVLALDAIVLQTILASVGNDTPGLGVLHPVNALIILGLGLYCHLMASRQSRA